MCTYYTLYIYTLCVVYYLKYQWAEISSKWVFRYTLDSNPHFTSFPTPITSNQKWTLENFIRSPETGFGEHTLHPRKQLCRLVTSQTCLGGCSLGLPKASPAEVSLWSVFSSLKQGTQVSPAFSPYRSPPSPHKLDKHGSFPKPSSLWVLGKSSAELSAIRPVLKSWWLSLWLLVGWA